MTEPTFTPIWDGPFPAEGPGQSWTSYLGIDGDPHIRLYVMYEPAKYPTVPYRYEATVAGNHVIYSGGVTTLSQAQLNVRDVAIRHLETLIAQAMVLMPDGYVPQAKPPEAPEPPPPDPGTVGQMYVIRALRYLKVSPQSTWDTEKTAMWMAVCELLRDVSRLGSRVHDMEQEMHERFQP